VAQELQDREMLVELVGLMRLLGVRAAVEAAQEAQVQTIALERAATEEQVLHRL
jgi:hypothetical protein